MPSVPVTNFDPARIPITTDEVNFHADATYVFEHMASEVIPDFNTNIDWLNAALAGSDTIVGSVANIKSGLGSITATYGGTANSVTLTTGLDLTTIPQSVEFVFKATSANTSGTTINVDGIGAVTCKSVTGVNLPSGYIRTDALTRAYYDGTNFIVGRETELGNNANGYWEKRANGVLECWASGVAPAPCNIAQDDTLYGEGTWTLPHPAIDAFSVVTATARSSVRYWTRASVTETVATLKHTRIQGGPSSATESTFDARLMGRWY